jgi:5'-deoxynucleotidase YfbR-like HD superfamily hydrolase
VGNWLGTVTGKKINLLNPDPDQICLEDIALALDKMPRFNGHTTGKWSVLDHSLAVASLVSPEYKLQALLHDATEAYICDIPSPLKALLGEGYKSIERRLAKAIGIHFGVELVDLPMAIKRADAIMLMTEHDAFQPISVKWETDFSAGLRVPDVLFNHQFQTSMKERFIREVNHWQAIKEDGW